MPIFNDLWKKLKAGGAPERNQKHPLLSSEGSDDEPAVLPPISTKLSNNPNDVIDAFQAREGVVDAFQANEMETLQKHRVIENLKALKDLMQQPKGDALESRFLSINNYLNIKSTAAPSSPKTQPKEEHKTIHSEQRPKPKPETTDPSSPECYETVRQERWHSNIFCPHCGSNHIKRLAQITTRSPYNHRYRCMDCDTEFSDDTDTPFEKGIPPLYTWMQVWYLLGCTDSLTYIANKLNLDIASVKVMVRQLQKTFGSKKPLSKFLESEWNQQSLLLSKQLKEDLLKQYEFLNADTGLVPKGDSREFLNQQAKRRNPGSPDSTIAPPSSKPGGPRAKF